MHSFIEMLEWSVESTLASLRDRTESIFADVEAHAATITVKRLQMIRLQKAMLVVGAVSVFEGLVQQSFQSIEHPEDIKKFLRSANDQKLLADFESTMLAVNVLKHGRGRSYRILKNDRNRVFRMVDEVPEGDVSTISVLIDVDDEFVRHCLEVLKRVHSHLEGLHFAGDRL